MSFISPKISILLLRLSFGIIYIWFGLLKFFPGLSPAEGLSGKTIHYLSFGILDADIAVKVLAVIECAIGLGFLLNKYFKRVLVVMLLHMLCTFSTFVILPEEMFTVAPFGLTLVGQYVIKNLILIGAGMLILNVLNVPEPVKTQAKSV